MSRYIDCPQDRVAERQEQWSKELPDLDTTAMAILGRARLIALAVTPAIEKVFAGYGLDRGEFDVLSTLLRSGHPYRLRPTELYKSLMISSGGLTDRLNRLEKAGLVRRTASEEDARSMLVQLTAKGKTRAEKAFREDMAVEKQFLEGIEPTEIDQLSALLAKLALQIERRLLES